MQQMLEPLFATTWGDFPQFTERCAIDAPITKNCKSAKVQLFREKKEE
ncbi:hypothetical protein [Paenibacillus cisolokensis]|nr:hypothetical protein [Paenibacillus cisolokensis]